MSTQMRLVAVAAVLAALSSRAAQAAADGTSNGTARAAEGRRRPFLARPGEPQGPGAPAVVTPLDAVTVAEGNNASAAGQALVSEGGGSEVAVDPLALNVWCVCSAGALSRVCGKMYYTLIECDPLCPSVCHAKGMSFSSCAGSTVIDWMRVFRFKWTDCANSPRR